MENLQKDCSVQAQHIHIVISQTQQDGLKINEVANQSEDKGHHKMHLNIKQNPDPLKIVLYLNII